MDGRRPLRVLVGMPFAEPLGGSERLLLALLGRARESGLDPTVVLLADGSMRELCAARGARVTVLTVPRPNAVRDAARAVRAARALIAAERPDVVLSWHSRAHLYLGPAARLVRPRPAVAWWQHHVPVGSEPLEAAATLVPADLVVATSAAAARAQAGRRPRRRTMVVHPGIEPPVVARPAGRAELGLPVGIPVAGIVGRLVAWKGQDRFLRALALLRERGQDVAGLVVGGTAHGLEPSYGPALRALVAELGLDGRVIFTGQVADPLPLVAACDVLVNASAPEPFGMTLLEAMALGVPVVAVAQGGPLEIVEDGVSGLLAADGSRAALATAIGRVVGDADTAARLAAGGRERFAARFTAERMAAQTAKVLRELAAPDRIAHQSI